jgi:hypothetical protein
MDEVSDALSRPGLTRVGTEGMYLGSEGARASHQSLDRQRTGDVCCFDQDSCPVQGQHPHGGHAFGSVEEGEAFLRLKLQGFEIDIGCGDNGTIDSHLTFANQRQCQMGEGGEIS